MPLNTESGHDQSMKLEEVLKKLEALGSAQTRKTYGRHGVTGDMYGVKFGDLSKLVKQIKVDHELALALWSTGNHDARVLATMIADPGQLAVKILSAWIKDVDNHVTSWALSSVAAKSPAGLELMRKWMAAKSEWPAATGWMMLSSVVKEAGAVSLEESKELLATIEEKIHSSKNRVKYSMNTAMIAMGAYVPGFEATAIKVANRIGQVEVDHGLTNCQTPLAAPYIRKAAAHHRAKIAKKAAGEKAARRNAGSRRE